ncbi:hypothetical protein [Pseudomonas sp. PD9R]|uniref:hypothetical protein n=1 Tax=Pseudomonas sp. PD9R TaxID=2853534 RepID=UPI001C44EE85|nr:hypothetical protein [Pseudomonas sp. PD9R]MBV6823857.1 hypothetical protein [Pseudomonas sp. PD9R]
MATAIDDMKYALDLLQKVDATLDQYSGDPQLKSVRREVATVAGAVKKRISTEKGEEVYGCSIQ